jgi:hypothetical protein
MLQSRTQQPRNLLLNFQFNHHSTDIGLHIGRCNIKHSLKRLEVGSARHSRVLSQNAWDMTYHIRKLHAQQELKNQKIREQLLRTERELHGILQKKYDIMEYARWGRSYCPWAKPTKLSFRREERFRMRAEISVGTSLGARPVTVSRNNEVDKSDRISWMRVETGFSTGNPLGALPQDVRRGRAILALADLFRLYMGDDDNTNHSQMVLHAWFILAGKWWSNWRLV